ncbi:SUMO-specific isopeptidase USPL1 [Tinamus guttatus]|uniref:SUMO-specific isopeptidase USPL1 n=1 Tax=Tinamus guttatus TaxID=94827 RepID=A0A099Z9Z9_TINGU|nr:SUMO-specific isopeptidase USPL1 [Tinamus guttatus]
MDTQKTTNGLQVIGPGTGIGISTLPMVGYLGKNRSPVEVTAHEYCPVCKEKGQTQALRTYRINFQESIFLCENPQCIYPLGYKTLNSIIISADSEKHQIPGTDKKRKLCDISDFSPIESHPKQARTNNGVDVEQTINANPAVKYYEDSLCAPGPKLPDELQNDQQKTSSKVESLLQKVDTETINRASSDKVSPSKTSLARTQLLPNPELCSTASELLLKDDKSSTNNSDLCLQWRNVYALCWLNCVLSALVHLETLKSALTEEYTEEKCLLQRLLRKYNQATALLNTCKRSKVKDVLPKAESNLNEVRNRIFTQLQPLLGCKLGEEESPVFALPLLLRQDCQAEKLFLSSFSWKFECLRCGYKYQDRCRKTLTTFTNIISDWHPLNAVHIGPCNNCNDKSQRRQMILEKVPTIFMLHFVEGLPHNNLKNYSFQFEGDSYQITSIIQYQSVKKHFITWCLNADGSWLECDDLKGPYCKRHKRFEVPPSEIFIVFWEKKVSHVPKEANSQFPSKNIEDFPLNNVQSNSTAFHCGLENAIDRIAAEHHKEDSVRIPDKKPQQVAEDERGAHRGSEKLAHDDVITLTLVEIQVDSEAKSPENRQMVGNNLVVETDLAMNNKCTLSEDCSISLPLEELNIANITPPVPKNQDSYPSYSPLAQRTDDRANLFNTENGTGLSSEFQLKKNLSLANNITQKSPDLKDGSKIVVDSQIANASAANNPLQPSHKDQKRGFVGSWVKKLLSKNTSFMPSSASTLKNERNSKTPLVQKISDVRLPVKGASNFDGFQGRGANKMAETPKLAVSQSKNIHPLSNFKGFSANIHLPTKNHIASEGPTWRKSSVLDASNKVVQLNSPSSNSGKVKESDTDQTKKLRQKLLKKLNAKKKKLASLDRLAVEQMKHERPVNGGGSTLARFESHNESHNDSELLQTFLRELQHQIDNASDANSVSVCTGHDANNEILAELLSPASTVASLEVPRGEEECMYLEMGDSSVAPAAPARATRVSHDTVPRQDHNYYSPAKDSSSQIHAGNKSGMKKLAFESPTSEDILEDLFSISEPSSIAGDIDLPHFDETLFENW